MITHSYVDDVVGRALAKVDEIGETNRTIVVFHSDHGYQRTSVLLIHLRPVSVMFSFRLRYHGNMQWTGVWQ